MTQETSSTPDRLPLAEEAGSARLIVCESTGAWAVALRRELAAWGVRLHETRSLPECWDYLARYPASFVVVELTRANGEEFLRRMGWLEWQYPLARVAVVASRAFSRCAWGLRAAGVVHVLTSPRHVAPLAEAARRHLAAAPKSPRSLAEEIWMALPWGKEGAPPQRPGIASCPRNSQSTTKKGAIDESQ